VALLGVRTAIAIDASGVAGGTFPRGRSAAEPTERVRVALPEGALEPSATETNLVRPAEVKAALLDLLERLGRPTRVVAVLPLGIGRLALLQPALGAEPRDFARFRLGPSLPFAVREAVIDTVPTGGGGVLAGAVRRTVVAEFEDLVASCGVELARVDLAPLAALAARQRERPAEALDVFLGDRAYALALHEAGALRAFRCRRRAPGGGDVERIAETLRATARESGRAVTPRVLVFGESSGAVAAGLTAQGFAASSGSDGALLGAAA